MWKTFIFINFSLAIKINVNHVYQTPSSENSGYAPLSGKFLLSSFSSWNQLGDILLHSSISFILGSSSICRKIRAPPAQPSCSRPSVETHDKEPSLWAVWNTKLAIASLLDSLHLVFQFNLIAFSLACERSGVMPNHERVSSKRFCLLGSLYSQCLLICLAGGSCLITVGIEV